MAITFTETAHDKILGLLKAKGQDGFAVRLRITGRDTDDFLYEFRSVEQGTRREGDTVLNMDGFDLFVDAESLPHLDGATIDLGGLAGGGFKIDNPNPVWTSEIARKVAEVINTQINPAVAAHSGRIALVDVEDDVAYVKMEGGCQGCGLAGVTLSQGIQKQIMGQVPEVKSVVDVTHHAQGENPYYAKGQAGQSPVTR